MAGWACEVRAAGYVVRVGMSASLVPRDPGTVPAGQRGRVTESARSKPKIREAPTKNGKGDILPLILTKSEWEGITIPFTASGLS